MFTRRRDPQRPNVKTTEQAASWLARWSNEHLIADGEASAHPWDQTSRRDLISAADSLLKVRAMFDANGRRPTMAADALLDMGGLEAPDPPATDAEARRAVAALHDAPVDAVRRTCWPELGEPQGLMNDE